MQAMYRPPSHPPVTAWARHLDQVMRTNKWSRVRLFEEVGAELGYSAKSRSAMLPLLIDKEPTPEQKVVLARHFGEPPAEPEPVKVEPPPDLATALSELAAELRASREQREKVEKDLADLKAAVKRLVERGTPTNPGLRVPDGTVG